MRGGYNGRGRGGFMAHNSNFQRNNAMPTDTISIRVSEIRQPVTEDVMRRVFDSAAVKVSQVSILPSTIPTETTVLAQFPDAYTAERVMQSLNNRNIFNDGNRMTMRYTQWPQGSPHNSNQNINLMIGMGGVLPTPTQHNNIPPSMSPNMHNSMNSMPNNGMPYVGAAQPNMYNPQMPMPPSAGGCPPPGNYSHNATFQSPGFSPGFPQMPLPTPEVRPMAFPGQGERGGYRGRGRGDRGGRGMMGPNNSFNPMMPASSMQPMQHIQGGVPYPAAVAMPVNQNAPTVYLSVTSVPESEPLQSIYTLLEAYGGVVSIRRNHHKREIVAVKMASTNDADAVIQYMRRVPFAGGYVSGKRFPTYLERQPNTDDGDPLDPATIQFDFTASRHRSPGQRSKCEPSNTVKVTGCAKYSEPDLMTYFSGKNFYPERIAKASDGSFMVQVADVDTAVKLLIACHGNVCGEERSNVIFVGERKAEEVMSEMKS